MLKLTPAQVRALEWLRDNGPSVTVPIAFRTWYALQDRGLVFAYPRFGGAERQITDLGRTALAEREAAK
jgi:hypothetical protein